MVNNSDERLKTNIEESSTNALEKIKEIIHRSFDWKENGKHINIGYIAQELMKVDPNFVLHDEYFDTYQIDLLYVLATSTKAIQELSAKVNSLEQELKEIKEMLKNKEG